MRTLASTLSIIYLVILIAIPVGIILGAIWLHKLVVINKSNNELLEEIKSYLKKDSV